MGQLLDLVNDAAAGKPYGGKTLEEKLEARIDKLYDKIDDLKEENLNLSRENARMSKELADIYECVWNVLIKRIQEGE